MTDPQAVAAAIRAASGYEELARALLQEYGDRAPLHWDVGASEMLVMRPGWNLTRPVGDYLWISHRA